MNTHALLHVIGIMVCHVGWIVKIRFCKYLLFYSIFVIIWHFARFYEHKLSNDNNEWF